MFSSGSHIHSLISMTYMFDDIREKNKEKCDEIVNEYWAISKWPRKKKKRRRKELKIDYSIFSWDLFGNY